MEGDFIVRNWGTEKIDVREKGPITQLKPTECHIKLDGSIGDKPSLAFILVDAYGRPYFAQISLNMFEPALQQIDVLRAKENPQQ